MSWETKQEYTTDEIRKFIRLYRINNNVNVSSNGSYRPVPESLFGEGPAYLHKLICDDCEIPDDPILIRLAG